uniref:Uncharacterized protein n=1 Tax=Solanum lycopersicum TaxID=4081 RepID=K4BQG0_SOLLC
MNWDDRDDGGEDGGDDGGEDGGEDGGDDGGDDGGEDGGEDGGDNGSDDGGYDGGDAMDWIKFSRNKGTIRVTEKHPHIVDLARINDTASTFIFTWIDVANTPKFLESTV